MAKYYPADFLRKIRNQVPIDAVIIDLLNLEVQNDLNILRFRCPLCYGFHTATNHQTNLARCFDCQQNFNPIDLLIVVEKCSFVDAVEILKDRITQ